MPKLMKKKMASIRMPNEDAFQMLKGSIGSLATFASQYGRPAKWMTDKIRRAIS
jgi:hypothetical protein